MSQSIINGEPTISDVLDAVNKFANKVEERFDGVELDIKEMKSTMTTLATKDFVSQELTTVKGDIILTMRKEDKKIVEVVEILHKKNVIDDVDVKRVVSMEPFPQLSV